MPFYLSEESADTSFLSSLNFFFLFLFVTAIVRVIRFFISPGRLRKLFSWSELDASLFQFDRRVSGSTRHF
jgi:hypothetical protein